MTNNKSFKNDPTNQDEDWVSKTEIKRQVKEVQAIGESLCILRPDQLDKIDLGDELRAAIDESRRIKPRSNAMKRHMGYVGRLMRTMTDEELEEVKLVAERFDASKQAHTDFFHKLERTRDQLINGGNEKLEAFLADYPAADIQHLRQLIRNAKKEAEKGQPKGAGKKLFQYIRELAEI